MIGTSDGQQHEDEFNYLLSLHVMGSTMPVGAPGKPAGALNDEGRYTGSGDLNIERKPTAPSANDHMPVPPAMENLPSYLDQMYNIKKWSPGPFSPGQEVHIDRTKDVPLAASALHKDGEMYGIAIDKDAPHKPEYDQYIYKHEADEFAYMKDLIKNGMSPTEAYPKAHDHITPMESARVQADLGEKGLEDYKQYWRDVASVSTAKETADRHPDAHTTTYGLDEHELGRSFRKEAIFRGLKGAGINKTDAEFQPLNPMTPGYSNPGGHAQTGERWFRGADTKWRQEIPDVNAKLKSVPEGTSKLTLGGVLDHPELYKSYPHLKDINIKAEKNPEYQGHLDYKTNSIHLSPTLNAEELKSVLMHEIQHVIQNHEGFDRGTNADHMLKVIKKHAKEEGIPILSKDESELAIEAYHRSTGEVEARNVQRRLKYPLASKIFSPELTEDVPRSMQIPTP